MSSWLTEGTPFVVNILDDTQTDMIVHFGRGFSLGEAAFKGLEVDAQGGVVLTDALACLDCRVEGSMPAGDHDLFVARVVGGRVLRTRAIPWSTFARVDCTTEKAKGSAPKI